MVVPLDDNESVQISISFRSPKPMIIKNEEEIESTHIYIKGELDKVKLDRSQAMPKMVFLSNSKYNHTQSVVNPVKVYSQGTALAAIDSIRQTITDNNQGWLLAQKFDFPVNLSDLIRNKISHIYLGQKELIALTKKGYYLINWGMKKLLDKKMLAKQSISASSNFDALFEVFTIPGSQLQDLYYYSPQKKVDNSNRLYFFDSLDFKLHALPTGNIISFKKKLKGLSVGSFYCFCWDQDGQLFSWGNRSIGLGLIQLPTEEFIETPQPIKINKKVISAIAGDHYSLALTQQGVIYEWGSKKEVNQINQEPIFKPRPLQFKYFKNSAKFVALKGKDNNYTALSSSGQLYVWGSTAKKLISQNILLPSTWKGNYLFEPVLQTQFLGQFINDFSIDHGYLAVATGAQGDVEAGNKEYWTNLKMKAQRQLEQFKNLRISTQSQEIQQLKRKYKNSILNSRSTTQRKGKSSQEKSLIPKSRKKQNGGDSLRESSLPKALLFKKTAPVTSDSQWPMRMHKRQVSDISNLNAKESVEQNNRWRTSEISQSNSRVGRPFVRQHKFSQLYQLKLHQILQKKKQKEELAMHGLIRKIAQESIEYRLQRKQEELQRLKMQQQRQILKQSLQNAFIQPFVVTLVRNMVENARAVKLQNIVRYLSIQKMQRTAQNILLSKQMRMNLEQLKSSSSERYRVFTSHFKNYIKRFRNRKYLRQRQFMIKELVKESVRQKMAVAMISLKRKVSKLHRLKQWLRMYRRQEQQSLKEVWNNFVTITFKVKDGGEFYFNQSDPQVTLSKVFDSRKESNPMLKLDKYMKFSMPFFSSFETLPCSRKNPQKKRKGYYKLHQQARMKYNLTADILPFSLHYNIFRRPKHLDLNVGQANRSSSLWIQIQKKTLEEHLKGVLLSYWLEYVRKRRQYQIDMANFIVGGYDTFYEKRWKYILQYNKVQRTRQKVKKEGELKRLLGLVGKTSLLEDDFIPQKHLVLEEALKRRDVPTPPKPVIKFDLLHFQDSFKCYVQKLKSKIRLNKRSLY